MTLAQFVNTSIDSIRRGVDAARESGVDCRMPESVEFEVPVGWGQFVGGDGPTDYMPVVTPNSPGRLRFTVAVPPAKAEGGGRGV